MLENNLETETKHIKRIGEIIGQEYKKWNKGNTVFINAGTGTGKSYFIENTFDEYCINNKKSILYLTNRDILKEQVKKDLDDFTNITVLNYQKIEAFILHRVTFDNYDYVVMDEAHYFFTDASFNNKTDLFFKKMLADDSICKILMTATPIILVNYFKKHNVQIDYTYTLPTDYGYIDKIIAFNTYESIDSIIEDIPEDEQILLFSSATKMAIEISKKYNGAFICSKNNKNGLYEKHVKDTENEEEIKSIIETGTYKNHILCTTTVLDNGINIKEFSNVKHIIIDILDRDEFLQCLGRKRIGEGEKINLYFYSYKNDNRRINGFKKKIVNSLDRADYLIEHGEVEYVNHKFKNEKYTDTRIIDDIINSDNQIHKQVNDCIYTKYHTDLVMYNAILDKKHPLPYKNIIACQLGILPNNITEMEVSIQMSSLKEVLESLVGKKLYKDEQKELINFIDLRQNGKQLKNPLSFNASFEEQKIPYMIITKRSSERIDGKVKSYRYWEVVKLED